MNIVHRHIWISLQRIPHGSKNTFFKLLCRNMVQEICMFITKQMELKKKDILPIFLKVSWRKLSVIASIISLLCKQLICAKQYVKESSLKNTYKINRSNLKKIGLGKSEKEKVENLSSCSLFCCVWISIIL